jgi:hypothetical protein
MQLAWAYKILANTELTPIFDFILAIFVHAGGAIHAMFLLRIDSRLRKSAMEFLNSTTTLSLFARSSNQVDSRAETQTKTLTLRAPRLEACTSPPAAIHLKENQS